MINPKLKAMILFSVVILTLFVGFRKRSLQQMNEIAKAEFLGYMSEYRADTVGFSGPYLELVNNDELLYRWKKIKDDTTSAELKVFVTSRRFSNTAVGSSGSQEYWKTLRHQVN